MRLLTLRDAASIGDLAAIARRRMPGFAFDYLDGAAGDDRGMRRNEEALAAILFRTRHLVGGPARTAVEFLGRSYKLPTGIAPMGMANMLWPGMDLVLARLAQKVGIPYVLSTAATTSIEQIVEAAPDVAWFQLYVSRDLTINEGLLKRAWAAGIRVLAVTVDVPVPQKRNRNHRHRFDLPFRPHPRFLLDLLAHPRWAVETLRAGMPNFENFVPYAGLARGGSIAEVGRFLQAQGKRDLLWEDVERIRGLWPGHLLIKGVMDAEDASRFLRIGADGLWVSNHGGRQLESAPASIDVLRQVRAAVGPHVPVVFDSGVRTGESIAKARALGADLAMSGRAFAYGAAAGGAAGARKAYDLLELETRYTLLQIGCPDINDLSVHILRGGADQTRPLHLGSVAGH